MAAFSNYKKHTDSGTVIGKLPACWHTVRLGYISEVVDPQPDHRAPAIASEGGFPYIGIRDVNKDGSLCFETARQVVEKAVLKQEKSFQIEPKDILFGKVGTLGQPKHIKPHGRFALSATLVLIKGKNINRDFLKYALDSHVVYEQIENLSYGATRPALGIQQIRKLVLAVPFIEEQKRIADFLDRKTSEIDQAIAQKQRLIKLLQEQKAIVINQAVTKGINPNVPMRDSDVEWLEEIPITWNITKLKFMVRIKNGQDYKDFEVQEPGYPVVGSGGRFAYASKYLFEGESVLLGRKGTIDKPLYINGAFWTVDTMFYSKIYSNTFPKFFYYCALTIPFGYYSTNTAVPSMTQEALSNHILAYPPIEEQKRIADFLDRKTSEIDQAIAQKNCLIKLLQEQKAIFISQAVTGKIKI